MNWTLNIQPSLRWGTGAMSHDELSVICFHVHLPFTFTIILLMFLSSIIIWIKVHYTLNYCAPSAAQCFLSSLSVEGYPVAYWCIILILLKSRGWCLMPWFDVTAFKGLQSLNQWQAGLDGEMRVWGKKQCWAEEWRPSRLDNKRRQLLWVWIALQWPLKDGGLLLSCNYLCLC